MNNKPLLFTLLGTIVFVAAAAFLYTRSSSSTPATPGLAGFAQCIAASGAKFYGAYWCPHCQNQKHEFGDAAQYLPYVECAASLQEQTQVCKDAKIEGYPTWRFADGSEATGEQPLATLAEKTGCPLPAGVAAAQTETAPAAAPTPEAPSLPLGTEQSSSTPEAATTSAATATDTPAAQ